MYQFTDGGLRNVWLENGYVEKDTPYGKAVSFHDIEGLTGAICLALAQKPGKLTGAEFRYLRSALQLTQRSIGKLLGCTEQAVAKWEKQGRIPKAEDYLIRRIYVEKIHDHERIGTVVDTLNAINQVRTSKIVLAKSHQKWTYKIEEPDREAIAA